MSGAVFLSYASQDAEAARRMCDALRAAGVEVWFDADGGLEHGDEWDAKIRRQIKECVLFIPLISANTQARHEGYFRIEWDLAAERARGIASGVAFLLPVVIDDTREPDALVPDKFRTVQWTRLRPPGFAGQARLPGELPSEVLQRFLKLWSHRTGVLKHEARPASNGVPAPIPVRATKGRWGLVAAGVVLLGVGAWLWSSRSAAPATPNPEPKTLNPVSGAAPVSAARQLAQRAAEILVDQRSPTDLETAETLVEQALALEKGDPDIWAIGSEIYSALHQSAGLSYPADELAAALRMLSTARSLDRSSYEVRRARAYFRLRSYNVGDPSFAEGLEDELRALDRERPRDPWTMMLLAWFLGVTRVDDSLPVFDEIATLPGKRWWALSEKGWILYRARRWEEAATASDESLLEAAFISNVRLKTTLSLRWRGDLDAALAALNQIAPADRQGEFGVEVMITYRWRRELEKALPVLQRLLPDSLRRGTAQAYLGEIRAAMKQDSAASNEWRQGLLVIEERLVKSPNDPALVRWQAYLLDALGDTVKAQRAKDLLRELGGGAIAPTFESYYDLRNRLFTREELLSQIEAGVTGDSLFFTPASLRLDPVYDEIRATPRFQAALGVALANPRLNPKPRL